MFPLVSFGTFGSEICRRCLPNIVFAGDFLKQNCANFKKSASFERQTLDKLQNLANSSSKRSEIMFHVYWVLVSCFLACLFSRVHQAQATKSSRLETVGWTCFDHQSLWFAKNRLPDANDLGFFRSKLFPAKKKQNDPHAYSKRQFRLGSPDCWWLMFRPKMIVTLTKRIALINFDKKKVKWICLWTTNSVGSSRPSSTGHKLCSRSWRSHLSLECEYCVSHEARIASQNSRKVLSRRQP